MGIVTKILNENFLAKSIRKITFTSMQTVESISAVFSQGNQIIYPNTSLESLRNSLTVTATYDDDSTREITGYTLTGSLVEGTSTITVSYEGHTTTFSVTVSHLVVLDSITAVFTQGQTPIYANTPLDSLKENLVVTANYDDGTYSNVIGADYNLVGTLQVGTSTVTVVYGEKTTTFEVLVSTGSLTVVGIDAVYTQGNTEVYETTSLNELKANLVVTATYTGGSTAIINDTDYALSGTLEQGISSITVTYENQTDTFDVIVSGAPPLPVEYQQVDYLENTTYTENNYIDTGVTIVPSTDKIVNTFEITSLEPQSNKYESPFGDWWAYRTKGIFCFVSSTGNGYIRAGGQNDLTSIQLGALSLNTPYTVSIYRYNVTLNGTVVSTGEDYGPSAPNTQLLFNTRDSSGSNVNLSPFLGKIYSHQIYRNDVLIHDFIPCYRKSDSKVGMYDMVANVFKPANGTIAKGPDSNEKVLSSISAVYTQGAQVIYPDTTLDTLKSNLVITATYDDASTEIITAAKYTLSGVLSLGTSTITTTYRNKTATFTVNVIEKPILNSINAVYTQGQTKVYPSTVLDTLKTDLVVTAIYSDSSTSVVGAGSYTLTGTLTVGTSVITVTYEGQTTTFNVIVSTVLPSGYQQVEYVANANVSSNPKGYIPLGITLTPSTDRVVTEFECTDFSAYTGNYFGAVYGDFWGNETQGIYNFLTNTASFMVRAGGKNIRVAHSTYEHAAYTALPANTKHTLDVYHDYVYINGILCGEPTGSAGVASNRQMYLFGSTNSNNSDFNLNSYFKGKIYNHKIYRNNVLIHNYVPCYRLSDNVIGVYDVIDNVFKPATGTLSKGSNVGP